MKHARFVLCLLLMLFAASAVLAQFPANYSSTGSPLHVIVAIQENRYGN